MALRSSQTTSPSCVRTLIAGGVSGTSTSAIVAE
eukprot:CAMPEP_0168335258 /NCGR_PEP_ID=MMETSP0213-20121227/10799_1 /TAXON_ID=151035 /ORGANISM="Euplotes harpa, Strain FSP1.4" /LENGTH=33 /DNA_ID= /DNA_START= /DNA_END= /DNA_ORIENTATION=